MLNKSEKITENKRHQVGLYNTKGFDVHVSTLLFLLLAISKIWYDVFTYDEVCGLHLW